jgi:hypothetical protein
MSPEPLHRSRAVRLVSTHRHQLKMRVALLHNALHDYLASAVAACATNGAASLTTSRWTCNGQNRTRYSNRPGRTRVLTHPYPPTVAALLLPTLGAEQTALQKTTARLSESMCDRPRSTISRWTAHNLHLVNTHRYQLKVASCTR